MASDAPRQDFAEVFVRFAPPSVSVGEVRRVCRLLSQRGITSEWQLEHTTTDVWKEACIVPGGGLDVAAYTLACAVASARRGESASGRLLTRAASTGGQASSAAVVDDDAPRCELAAAPLAPSHGRSRTPRRGARRRVRKEVDDAAISAAQEVMREAKCFLQRVGESASVRQISIKEAQACKSNIMRRLTAKKLSVALEAAVGDDQLIVEQLDEVSPQVAAVVNLLRYVAAVQTQCSSSATRAFVDAHRACSSTGVALPADTLIEVARAVLIEKVATSDSDGC
jgi:hypothetical protein